MEIKSEANWERVRSSPDYRSFLKNYLETRGLNISDLARAAGFARGSASDILTGRRRLTNKTFFAYEKALKLPSPGKKLFRCLVAQSEPDLFPDLPPEKVGKEIQKLRVQAWSRERRQVQTSDASGSWNQVLRDPNALSVYAACGEPGRGASHQQLLQRTSLAEAAVLRSLHVLQEAGLVRFEFNTSTWEPQDLHLFVQSLGQNVFVSQIFKRMSAMASERVTSELDSKEQFFFASSFCVSRERLPELKAELRKIILQYVDDAISPDGDHVAHVVTSMFL